MALEVGAVLEGKVTGITKFGAFVELPDGKTGMVHISEVASTYVKEIRDFITENQTVKVKVLAVTPEGRVTLSMKKVEENNSPQGAFQPGARAPRVPRAPRSAPPKRVGPGADVDFGRQGASPQNFEDMLSRFKQTSDDKMSDIRRNLDGKRGSSGLRKHGR